MSAPKPLASDLVKKYASEIEEKTVLVTGATAGLGLFFVEQLVQATPGPRLIIISGRDSAKLDAVKKQLNEKSKVEIKTLLMNLGSFESVKQAARQVQEWDVAIDVLINNAGIMAVPYNATEDGHELQLQTNHLSHFLFTNLIIDQILRNKGRVVSVSSELLDWV
jgi:NAD(P)-dependent dehydrogenase (short-subunit alcohol dehydrogenase family)